MDSQIATRNCSLYTALAKQLLPDSQYPILLGSVRSSAKSHKVLGLAQRPILPVVASIDDCDPLKIRIIAISNKFRPQRSKNNVKFEDLKKGENDAILLPEFQRFTTLKELETFFMAWYITNIQESCPPIKPPTREETARLEPEFKKKAKDKTKSTPAVQNGNTLTQMFGSSPFQSTASSNMGSRGPNMAKDGAGDILDDLSDNSLDNSGNNPRDGGNDDGTTETEFANNRY